jgi:hypothetical protein
MQLESRADVLVFLRDISREQDLVLLSALFLTVRHWDWSAMAVGAIFEIGRHAVSSVSLAERRHLHQPGVRQSWRAVLLRCQNLIEKPTRCGGPRCA